uniref:Uncharacterized protein n=1 Tax=Emiliania huxleyi TaxID=2903 RepID=A0A7S3WN03_EMIHU
MPTDPASPPARSSSSLSLKGSRLRRQPIGIVDRPLVRDLIFVLMSLHLPRGQRHAPATAELEAKVAAAIDALRRRRGCREACTSSVSSPTFPLRAGGLRCSRGAR